MRIFLSSMPLVALVAILSVSTVRRLDYAAQQEIALNGNALPETIAIFKKVQEKARLARERQGYKPLPVFDAWSVTAS